MKRIDEIDVIKGIGIFLVVLGHLEPGKRLMCFIYYFHVFSFYFCSGWLYNRKLERSLSSVIKKNVKRLLLPFFIWFCISQTFDLISGELELFSFVQNLFFINGSVGWNAALWFLISLFWAEMICVASIKKEKKLILFLIPFMLALSAIFSCFTFYLPFGLYTVPIASLFWLFGFEFGRFNILPLLRSSNSKSVLLLLTLVINVVFGSIFNDTISIYHNIYHNVLFTVVAGISGIMFIILISIFLCQEKEGVFRILKLYGRNTLLILCSHYLLLRLIRIISLNSIGIDLWRSVSTPKSIVLTALIMLFYYFVMNKNVRKEMREEQKNIDS